MDRIHLLYWCCIQRIHDYIYTRLRLYSTYNSINIWFTFGDKAGDRDRLELLLPTTLAQRNVGSPARPHCSHRPSLSSTPMRVRPSLVSVPPEVLEHIAFLTATDEFLGPPSAIIPLLSTNKRLNSCLSIKSNTLLYSRIFAAKFDVSPPLRRLRCRQPSAAALTEELQRRCYYLKRMRARLDSTVNPFAKDRGGDEILQSLLWTAYLMMLENDGKNERQLRDYAQIDVWLREFWFDDHGASFAKSSIRMDQWPPNNDKTSLGMWLFWFLLKPGEPIYTFHDQVLMLSADEYMDDEHSWDVVNTLKIFALGAHQVDFTHS